MTAETGSEEAEQPQLEQADTLKREHEGDTDGQVAKVARKEDGKADAAEAKAGEGAQSEEEKKKALLAAKKAALARILDGMSQAAEKDGADAEQKGAKDSAGAAAENSEAAAVADTSIVDFLRKEREGAVGKFLSAKEESLAAGVGVIAAAPVYERREPKPPGLQTGTLALQTTSAAAAAGPKAVSSRAGPSWAGKGGVSFAPQKWQPAPRAQGPAAPKVGWSPAPKMPTAVPQAPLAAAPQAPMAPAAPKESVPARPLFVPAAAKPGFGAPLPGAGRW
mmetsp:Transcript_63782/g.118484  ORF Transcript_63782/g.118484 Transcript_63782/m.118484 type:complete len:279 (-) Transcript_63782:56-892(-)